MDSAHKKHDAFVSFARRVGPLPTSAMASAWAPSQRARRAAQLLVGSLSVSDPERVSRLAVKLEVLMAADRAEVAGGQRAGKRRTNG